MLLFKTHIWLRCETTRNCAAAGPPPPPPPNEARVSSSATAACRTSPPPNPALFKHDYNNAVLKDKNRRKGYGRGGSKGFLGEGVDTPRRACPATHQSRRRNRTDRGTRSASLGTRGRRGFMPLASSNPTLAISRALRALFCADTGVL